MHHIQRPPLTQTRNEKTITQPKVIFHQLQHMSRMGNSNQTHQYQVIPMHLVKLQTTNYLALLIIVLVKVSENI